MLSVCLLTIFFYSIDAQMTQLRPADFDQRICSPNYDCTLNPNCLQCQFKECKYGDTVEVNCTTIEKCHWKQSVKKQAKCRFCWQTEPREHLCNAWMNCTSSSSFTVPVKCRVLDDVICMGRRTFFKNVRCNWTSGHSWSKALFLSLVMGGFGIDRFYLGLWKSGIGKLFSFGGLGIWTIVDVILIATGYIRPADGSHYV